MIRRLLTVALLGLTLSACSGGDSRLSVEDGKRLADKTRRPVAEAYWRLHSAIGTSVSQGAGVGEFTDCDEVTTDSVVYRIDSLVTSETKEKGSAEHLADVVATRLASNGWKLKRSDEVRRSAVRGSIKVELRPTGINDWSIMFQVQSECVNLGAAADVLENAYSALPNPEVYPNSQAASSPVPTGFPESRSS